MTLSGHLSELRRRLLIAIASVFVLGVVAWIFYEPLVTFLAHPYCAAFALKKKGANSCDFYVTGLLDPLSFRFQVAAYGGAVLAAPVILWELWRFITPGLKRNERKYATMFVGTSIALFALGAALAYWSFEHAIIFLSSIGGPKLKPIYGPNQYVGLLLLVMALYGIAFIFPVLLVSLELVGAVTSATLLKHWRMAVMAITCVAAVFTPTGDPVSMLALMFPLILFYFGAILVGRLLGK
jgi:sec-independent protein translocase protein TatC